jgi:hypothetical protein
MLAAAIGRYRREFVGLLMATLAIFAIVTNALFMQKGPHPAPIFATRPLLQRDAGPAPRLQAVQSTPVVDLANQARIQLIGNIQRSSRKGFYDGPRMESGEPRRMQPCGLRPDHRIENQSRGK